MILYRRRERCVVTFEWLQDSVIAILGFYKYRLFSLMGK